MAQEKPSRECCCKAEPTATVPCCQRPPDKRQPSAAVGEAPWVAGTVSLAGTDVPLVSPHLRLSDHLGAWKARWAIDRMGYRVPPGLYGIGQPTASSPVLVSANYKLSFDRLRSKLAAVDAWILVLDTQGVNVWCAAGKGTFGTDELVRRIEQFHLLESTTHRTVIVPQLAAPGVAAHEVRKRTGVRVIFGPVRAEDIPAFLAADMKATPAMRRVRFPFRERIALVPVEWVTLAKWPLMAAVLFFVLSGLGRSGFSVAALFDSGLPAAVIVLATSFGSMALGPALLPWLPGRAFALKGLWIGLAFLGLFLGVDWFARAIWQNWATTAAWCLLVPASASVLVLAFTGASTYTSLSGVRRETRMALPVQAGAAILGMVLWLTGRFL